MNCEYEFESLILWLKQCPYQKNERPTWDQAFLLTAMLVKQDTSYGGVIVHDKNIIATFNELLSISDISYHDSNVILYAIGINPEKCYEIASRFGISHFVSYYKQSQNNTRILHEESAFGLSSDPSFEETEKWKLAVKWMEAIPKHIYYHETHFFLTLAFLTSRRSSCLRKKVGSVIIRSNNTLKYEILSSGYNGSPSLRTPCIKLGYCYRDQHNIESGTNLERCRASGSHAESNAIALAAKHGKTIYKSDLYLFGHNTCCQMCKGLIINSGIKKVYHITDQDEYKEYEIDKEWIKFPFT